MNRTRVLATAGTVAGTAAFILGALASPASAHTPTYGKDCYGYHVTLSDYPTGSHRQLKVDGATITDTDFSGTWSKYDSWSPSKAHTIDLVVFSPDGAPGNVDWHATQQPCQEGSTTTGATTTALAPTTTAPAPTTTRPATITVPGATTVPVSPTTVVPATTAPATTAPTTIAPDTPNKVQQAPSRAVAAPPATATELPTTGDSPNVLIIIGSAAVIVGLILLAIKRHPHTA